MKAPTSTAQTSTQPFSQSLLVIFGFIVGISIILTVLSSIFGEKIPQAAQERYDNCVAIEQHAGVGIIKADGKCDYLKRS